MEDSVAFSSTPCGNNGLLYAHLCVSACVHVTKMSIHRRIDCLILSFLTKV